ncbi:MAG: hypothetical protein LBG80_01155 [Bacteroidales bacterium]|jgi:hypothetical protein|nr:hypothetical protein [Bacteroidales bacterium]
MKYISNICLFIVLLFSSNTVLSQNDMYRKVLSGIYIEIQKDTTNLSRYTEDNEIYRAENKYYFSYIHIDGNNNEYYYSCSNNDIEHCEYISKNNISDTTIVGILMRVKPDISDFTRNLPDYDQTVIEYRFITHKGDIIYQNSELTGLVENKKNIWMHPTRVGLFRILELCPFPFVQYPCKKGQKWKWKLQIGERWRNVRWITWKGTITNKYQYKVVDDDAIISTNFGELKCKIIKSIAKSRIGTTELTAYFNEIYGFVRLEYVNINKSKIIMQLIKFEKK